MMADGKTETVTRADIADEISSAVPSLSGKEAQRVVDNVIRGIRNSLVKGDEVKISGFGKFVLQTKNPRKGRNPKTGDEITIAGRRVMKFKSSDVLRESLNGNPFGGE
jgi:integration host factor subunit alpha